MNVELLVLLYATFKRHSGIYFWSIVFTVCGIVVYTTANILTSFKNNCPETLVHLFLNIGWSAMITGFSLVLWSRLHLVTNNSRFLKCVLVMILFDGIVWTSVAIGISFGLTLKYHKEYPIAKIVNYIEGIVFIIQEIFLSCSYMYFTARFLKSGHSLHTRKVISLLLFVQVLVVALDAALFVLVFTNRLTLATALHPFIQSIKLKLEFMVLNQLKKLVRRGLASNLSLPVQEPPTEMQTTPNIANSAPISNIDFRTTPHDSVMSPFSSSYMRSPTIPAAEKEIQEHHDERQDEDEIICSPRSVVGKLEEKDNMEDLEAIYLGRWDAEAKV